jgi:DinB superfamily
MTAILPAAIAPGADEYAQPYRDYVARVQAGNVLELLERQGISTAKLLAQVSPERAAYRYAPGKWSVTEIIGHLSDAERIFAYRALRIARRDETPLPGFDENDYTPAGEFDRRSLTDVAKELAVVRSATLALFRGLPDEAWTRRGTASNHPVSVRAMAHIIAGHELHHLEVLRTRYGLGTETA